ncbi:MAG: LptA/OstA family protein [Pseudomonadota bacterium]
MTGRLFALSPVLVVLATAPALAQDLKLGTGGEPIEIQANEGIEWHRESQRYIARGDASATQGETTVHADVLTAYYRPSPEGGTTIYRYDADGNVRIQAPDRTVAGERAVYDVDNGVLVITGRALKLTTPAETITARDSLEYWERRRMAVARGEATVVTADRRLRADILTSHFAVPDAKPPAVAAPKGPGPARPVAATPAASHDPARARLQRIEGFGNVRVATAAETVRADRGVYNAETGIATLAGSVKITRGKSQLNGELAEVDLNTGVSRLLARPGQGGNTRVRALLVPQDRPAAMAPASR